MLLSAGKEFCLLHFLPLDHLPQLRHGCPAVLFKQATSEILGGNVSLFRFVESWFTCGDQAAWQQRGLRCRGGRGRRGRCRARQVGAGRSTLGRSGAWGRWPATVMSMTEIPELGQSLTPTTFPTSDWCIGTILGNKEGFKTFMVARELDSEETRWPIETTEWQTWERKRRNFT